MPTSSCQSDQHDEAVAQMKAKRRVSLKRDMRQHIWRSLLKDVLIAPGISGHVDAALHIDRKELLVEVLRSLADELEKTTI